MPGYLAAKAACHTMQWLVILLGVLLIVIALIALLHEANLLCLIRHTGSQTLHI